MLLLLHEDVQDVFERRLVQGLHQSRYFFEYSFEVFNLLCLLDRELVYLWSLDGYALHLSALTVLYGLRAEEAQHHLV